MTLRIVFMALVFSALAGALPGATARAQRDWTRFEIISPSDTAFTIVLDEGTRWVRTGMTGIVVDPRQRDAMVARFSVNRVEDRGAVVRITGMTTGVTAFHAALLQRPPRSWLKQPFFWVGSALGLAIGFLAGRA